MVFLNEHLQELIMKQLPYNDLINYCIATYSEVCEDNYFWYRYIKSNMFYTTMINYMGINLDVYDERETYERMLDHYVTMNAFSITDLEEKRKITFLLKNIMQRNHDSEYDFSLSYRVDSGYSRHDFFAKDNLFYHNFEESSGYEEEPYEHTEMFDNIEDFYSTCDDMLYSLIIQGYSIIV